MDYVKVEADDPARIADVVGVVNAANAVDDPDAWPQTAEILTADLTYGYDLRPGTTYLCRTDDQSVGVLMLDLPTRDNQHLVFTELFVHPAHRRRGHGSEMVAEVFRQARAAGRGTVWGWAPSSGTAAAAFAARWGFGAGAQDARRRQVIGDLDWAGIEGLEVKAQAASADYDLVRLPQPPLPDDQLRELAIVAAAINDAPMGELSYEPEVFDLDRMRDADTARARRRERVYRVAARHRPTGELAGHTYLVTHPSQPTHAWQCDTAVSTTHRGHQLGMRLKIDALRWLCAAEPQITAIDTWNNATNDFMISVNEKLGYRLSSLQTTYELKLP